MSFQTWYNMHRSAIFRVRAYLRGLLLLVGKPIFTGVLLIAWYEPTSVIKSIRIHPALHTQYQGTSSLPPISFISPNIFELEHLFRYIRDPLLDQTSRINLSSFPRWFETIDSFELGTNFNEEISRLRRSGPGLDFLAQKGVMQMTIQLLPFFQHIIVKCGSQGQR